MALPVPTVAEVATFSGRTTAFFTSFIDQALIQATLLVSLKLDIADLPAADPELSLVKNAIMDMAYRLHSERPYMDRAASPFTSESLGSYCVDPDTEILTSAGWKDYSSLRVGEEVLTLNTMSGTSEWQSCEAVHVFPPMERSMLLAEGRRHNSLTTPNHRWFVHSTYGVPKWKTSESLALLDRVPVAALSKDVPEYPKYSDSLVEMVAWFWTEGSWNWYGHTRSVTVHQSHRVNPGNCERIRRCLTSLFGGPTTSLLADSPARVGLCNCGCGEKVGKTTQWRHTKDLPKEPNFCWKETGTPKKPDMSLFVLSADASSVITEHILRDSAGAKAVSTEFIRSLTQSQLELFIRISVLADGSLAGTFRNVPQLAQRSKLGAEQFALACILAGYPVSISQHRSSSMYMVTVNKVPHTAPRKLQRKVTFSGVIWCPQTANGTWFARRQGKCYFTGNSYSVSASKATQGEKTGVFWFDLAVQQLMPTQISHAGVAVFDQDNLYREDSTGKLWVLGPADTVPASDLMSGSAANLFSDPS